MPELCLPPRLCRSLWLWDSGAAQLSIGLCGQDKDSPTHDLTVGSTVVSKPLLAASLETYIWVGWNCVLYYEITSYSMALGTLSWFDRFLWLWDSGMILSNISLTKDCHLYPYPNHRQGTKFYANLGKEQEVIQHSATNGYRNGYGNWTVLSVMSLWRTPQWPSTVQWLNERSRLLQSQGGNWREGLPLLHIFSWFVLNNKATIHLEQSQASVKL